jgi:hypothetical protein
MIELLLHELFALNKGAVQHYRNAGRGTLLWQAFRRCGQPELRSRIESTMAWCRTPVANTYRGQPAFAGEGRPQLEDSVEHSMTLDGIAALSLVRQVEDIYPGRQLVVSSMGALEHLREFMVELRFGGDRPDPARLRSALQGLGLSTREEDYVVRWNLS